MEIGRILLLFILFAAVAAASPLKKEVLSLPSLFHFNDVFNLQKYKDQSEVNTIQPAVHRNPYLLYQLLFPGYLNYVGYQGYPGYSIYPGWPTDSQSVYSQPGYTQSGYSTPQLPILYPSVPSYPPYPAYPPHPSYPPYPSYPRKHDIDLVERYYKFNDDGSKEHKIVLSNGLTIFQKVFNKSADKQDIELLEAYYSARQDDNTYLTTYFRADENGYTASSELTDSPPSYPNVNQMVRLPASA